LGFAKEKTKAPNGVKALADRKASMAFGFPRV
jgi:hypothetical protein